MVVELAVVTPVMLVIAVVVLNLLFFLEACARFDRLVPDVVMALAVAPSGEQAEAGDQARLIREELTRAMDGLRGVEVRVEEKRFGEVVADEGLIGFTFAPHLTRYECTMTYTPWPAVFTVAGVDAGVPARLEHVQSFSVDRYRSAVLF